MSYGPAGRSVSQPAGQSAGRPAGKPAGWLEHYLAGYSPHSESHFPHKKKQRDNFTPAAQLPIFPVKIGGIIPGRVDLGTPQPTFHVKTQRDNFTPAAQLPV